MDIEEEIVAFGEQRSRDVFAKNAAILVLCCVLFQSRRKISFARMTTDTMRSPA